MGKHELKSCPFCDRKFAFYTIIEDRIMHKLDCYFKYDTIVNIHDNNKAWNTRANEKEGCE